MSASNNEPRKTHGLVYSKNGETAATTSNTRVGDGGASWRAKLAKRKLESSKPATAVNDANNNKDFYFQKAAKHIDKKRKSSSSSSSSSSFHASARPWPAVPQRIAPQQQEPPSQNQQSASRRQDVSDSDSSSEEEEEEEEELRNVNKLAAQAMKAKLKGKMKLFNKLQTQIESVNAKLKAREEKKKNKVERANRKKKGERVVLPSVDVHGRKIAFRDTGTKVNGDTEGGKEESSSSSAPPPSSSIKDMLKAERMGRHDERRNADREFAKYVMKTDAVDFDARNDDRFQEDVEEHAYSEGKNLTGKQKKGREKLQFETKQRSQSSAYAQFQREEAQLNSCPYCIHNPQCLKHLILSLQEHWSVSIPATKRLSDKHLLLTPNTHIMHCTALSDVQRESLQDIQTAIAKQWNNDVVFFQTVHQVKRNRHLVIHAVGLSREHAEQAPVYFNSALEQCDDEWSTHKKVIDTSTKSIYGCVPSNFPYFYVQFGKNQQGGMAHVIEDHNKFNEWLGFEIMCDLLEEPWQFFVRNNKRLSVQEELRLARDFRVAHPNMSFQ